MIWAFGSMHGIIPMSPGLVTEHVLAMLRRMVPGEEILWHLTYIPLNTLVIMEHGVITLQQHLKLISSVKVTFKMK